MLECARGCMVTWLGLDVEGLLPLHQVLPVTKAVVFATFDARCRKRGRGGSGQGGAKSAIFTWRVT